MNTSKPMKPGCLSSMEIAEIAEDLLPAAEAQSLLSHVAQCDRCAGELREARQALSRELTPEEGELLAECLAHPPRRRAGPARSKPIGWAAWGAAAAILLATVGGVWFFANRPDPVPGLLAQASAAGRPFDWRLPQAEYGPVQVQRSGEGLNPAAALLEAQALLAKRAGLGDAEFLRLRGWSELLEDRADEAVKTLEEARGLAPENLDIAGLLGVAYAARQNADRGADDALAMKQWGQVLARRPRDGAALFNRGLLHQRAGRTREAVADWRALLQVETAGPWSDEARVALRDGELKLR